MLRPRSRSRPRSDPKRARRKPTVVGLDFDYLLSAGDHRLLGARRIKCLSDGINRYLGIGILPDQTLVRCSRHDPVNSVDREASELVIDLVQDSSRLIVWCSRSYDD
jgi:hypothetical protein